MDSSNASKQLNTLSVKPQLALAVWQAAQKAGAAGGNFLENIEWILQNVTEDNFEDLGDLGLPVGTMSEKVKNVVGAESDLVYLKPRVYAKIRGWWDQYGGHSEITDDYFRVIPEVVDCPERILADKNFPNRYLFVFSWHHHTTIVIEIEVESEAGRNEIVTYFWMREDQPEEHKKVWTAAGRTCIPSVLAHHVKRGVAGSRFSGLQPTVHTGHDDSKKETKSQLVSLKHPSDATHGDYSTNIALQIASQIKQNSCAIAQKIVKNLKKPDFVKKVEIAGPGFINFWLSQEWLVERAAEIASDQPSGRTFLSKDLPRGRAKVVVIDYSSPNIARRFGVGHLRSTIIGQALYNIYEELGWEVVGDNHLGDWGTQFGRLIVAVKKWSSMEKLALSEDRIAQLQNLYVRFHDEAEQRPELLDEGRRWFKELERGNQEAREMWQQIVEWSLAEFESIYDLLGVRIDHAYGESFYEDKMEAIIEEAKDKGIARKSKGAWVIDVGDDMPPAMVVKSDGATTYITRDLAAIKYRIDTWDPKLIIYEVGKEQSLHFRQTFAAARKFGWKDDLGLVHVAHGHIRLLEGTMSTRKGRVILLEDLLNQAIDKAQGFLDEPNGELAKAIGIGAVKYNDLRQQPHKDIVFDWDKILNLAGNSGPYLQYTHARCKSVLREAGENRKTKIANRKSTSTNNVSRITHHESLNAEELSILRTLYQFPEVVISAASNFAPNKICDFLFDLAQKYNSFYQKHRILDAPEGEEIIQLRLMLTAATAQVLSQGLDLLGIASPNRI